MKKIMLVTSNISPVPATKGGAVELLIQLLTEENEKNHKVELIVISKWEESAEKISRKYSYTKNLYYKNREDLSFFQKIKSLPFDIRCSLIWVKELCKRKKRTCRYYVWAYLQALKFQPDYIVAEAGLYENFEIFKNHFHTKQMWAHLHRVVVGSQKEWNVFKNAIGVSNYISEKYKNGNDKINTVTIYNCVNEAALTKKADDNLIESIKSKFNISSDDFIITYTGRICQQKGVKELAEAVLSITDKNIRLCIIGASEYAGSKDTEYVKEIQEIAKKSEGRIFLTGYVDNSLLVNYFSISKLHVVPSIYEEPGALTPLEAMIAGVPVVISNTGGIIEYVDNAYPMVIHRGEEMKKELVSWIEKCYVDEQFRIECIKKGKDNAKRFTCEIYYKEFLKVFC